MTRRQRWSSNSPEARAQLSALNYLARARPGQLQGAFKRLPFSPPRPNARLFAHRYDLWGWRPVESMLENDTSAPLLALSSIIHRPGRMMSMTVLTRLARLPRLESLSLLGISRRNRGRALEQLGNLPRLRELRLGGNSTRPVFVEHDLQFVPSLPRLRALGVWACDASLAPLAEAPRLEELHLNHAWLPPARSRALGRLDRLRTLNLDLCQGLDRRGLQHLAHMDGLRQLGLGSSNLSSSGLEVVGGMVGLQALDLRAFRLTDQGIDDHGLARLRGLERLERLDLWGNRRITDEGARALGSLRGLTWLNLDGSTITDAGLAHLHSQTNLRFLNLGVSEVTDQALDRLRRALTFEDAEILHTTPQEHADYLDRCF